MKSYMLNIPSFQYPESFKKIIELKLIDFDIWHLLDADWAAALHQGLQTRYPERQLIPFAKRGDCDDTACFEIGKGGKVQLIHDFARPGWEQRQEFPACWAWLAQAVNDMIEYNREDGIV
ncbi:MULTISPECIES: hypothetical protein [Eikenella]|uniref:Uncharacterized protein n=1 Tax=Eikenella longinqua TaxID=1795827 RepID=A0A1A9RVT1_9NEIS|nr:MULTISPECIES: hypothetical protein [Eikenella]OAM26429.1 hypothetical protein A7P95_09625 [Eikenella longinqua]